MRHQGDAITVSHVPYPGLGGPGELGYDGVVMSDLCMGAITKHHGVAEARIDQSVARVLGWKARVAGYQSHRRPPQVDPTRLSAEIARRSLTRIAVRPVALVPQKES
jgi:beta-glucosidase-like glycosyl hydrolase